MATTDYILGTPVSTNIRTGGQTSDISISHTLAAGNNRVVMASVVLRDAGEDTLESATYGGVAMKTPDSDGSPSQNPAGSKAKTYLYYLLDSDLPADGANTLQTLYTDDGIAGAVVAVSAFKDLAQQAPEVYVNGNSALSTNDGGWITPISTNTLICGMFGLGSTNTVSAYTYSGDTDIGFLSNTIEALVWGLEEKLGTSSDFQQLETSPRTYRAQINTAWEVSTDAPSTGELNAILFSIAI